MLPTISGKRIGFTLMPVCVMSVVKFFLRFLGDILLTGLFLYTTVTAYSYLKKQKLKREKKSEELDHDKVRNSMLKHCRENKLFFF
jgi:hypothetical protein